MPLSFPLSPMTNSQIIQFLYDQGVVRAESIRNEQNDGLFAHVTEAWLRGTFCPALKRYVEAIVPPGYHEEAGDCDDHADRAVRFAKDLHLRHSWNSGRALAVGTFTYHSELGGQHKIMYAITAEPSSGKPKLLFIEPQLYQVVKLTPTEIASCTRFSL